MKTNEKAIWNALTALPLAVGIAVMGAGCGSDESETVARPDGGAENDPLFLVSGTMAEF